VLTRVGRTAQRNLDNLSLAVLGSAELFRHAERVVARDRNMLPLQNQTDRLGDALTDSVVFRLQGLCLGAGLDEDSCTLDVLEGLLGGELCLPPLMPCAGESSVPVEQALVNVLTEGDPELRDALLEAITRNAEAAAEDRAAAQDAEEQERATEPADDEEQDGGLFDGLGSLFGRDGDGGDR
jgi:hypothetical protein